MTAFNAAASDVYDFYLECYDLNPPSRLLVGHGTLAHGAALLRLLELSPDFPVGSKFIAVQGGEDKFMFIGDWEVL
jgi:hypothetical protein